MSTMTWGQRQLKSFLHYPDAQVVAVCDVASGSRSTIVAHLGCIALWTGPSIEWDPVKEEIIGDAAASRMLSRAMREPWTT
jgi:hypothetical protein